MKNTEYFSYRAIYVAPKKGVLYSTPRGSVPKMATSEQVTLELLYIRISIVFVRFHTLYTYMM